MPIYYCPGGITKQSWNMRADLHESKLENALQEYIYCNHKLACSPHNETRNSPNESRPKFWGAGTGSSA